MGILKSEPSSLSTPLLPGNEGNLFNMTVRTCRRSLFVLSIFNYLCLYFSTSPFITIVVCPWTNSYTTQSTYLPLSTIYNLLSTIYYLPYTIYHVPSTTYHPSSTIYHLPSIIHHLPSIFHQIIHRVPSIISHLPFVIQHLPSIYHPSFHPSSIIYTPPLSTGLLASAVSWT